MITGSALTYIATRKTTPLILDIMDQDGGAWFGPPYVEHDIGLEAGTPLSSGLYCSKETGDGVLHFVGGNNYFPNRGVYARKSPADSAFTIRQVSTSMIRGIDFKPDNMNGVCADSGGRIFVTADGGNSWTKVYDMSNSLYEGFFKVKYDEILDAWFVSGMKGILLQSTDGVHWVRRIVGRVDANGNGYEHPALASLGQLVILGSIGYQLLISDNAGADFPVVMPPLDGYGLEFRGATIVNSTLAFICGDVGVLVRAEKVNDVWTPSLVPLPTAAHLNGCVYNPATGILTLVGQGETIYESTNFTTFTKINGDPKYDSPSLVIPIGPPPASTFTSILPKKSTGKSGR